MPPATALDAPAALAVIVILLFDFICSIFCNSKSRLFIAFFVLALGSIVLPFIELIACSSFFISEVEYKGLPITPFNAVFACDLILLSCFKTRSKLASAALVLICILIGLVLIEANAELTLPMLFATTSNSFVNASISAVAC